MPPPLNRAVTTLGRPFTTHRVVRSYSSRPSRRGRLPKGGLLDGSAQRTRRKASTSTDRTGHHDHGANRTVVGCQGLAAYHADLWPCRQVVAAQWCPLSLRRHHQSVTLVINGSGMQEATCGCTAINDQS